MKIEPQIVSAMGQDWNVAVLGDEDADRTLLLCNGIGASLDTVGPFVRHFKRTRLVVFDVPGVGGSPTPVLPYRFANLSRMLARVLDQLGIGKVDVFGVSWGGALAQQFVHDHQPRCRSMTLAATTAGAIMVPGRLGVIKKMATPKRYTDPDYLFSIAKDIYGGGIAFEQELLKEHTLAIRRRYARLYLSTAGGLGLDQLSVAAPDPDPRADPDGQGRSAGAAGQRPHSGAPPAQCHAGNG